jgi:hypothetical protein
MKTCCQGIQHRRNTNQNQGDKGEQRTRKWVLSKHNSKIMEQACSKYECGATGMQEKVLIIGLGRNPFMLAHVRKMGGGQCVLKHCLTLFLSTVHTLEVYCQVIVSAAMPFL